MLEAVTLDHKVMKYNADCVEWCPIKEFYDMFVCGTYQLIERDEETLDMASNNASRLGSINLYRVNQKGMLVLQHRVDTPGILDMKWCSLTSSLNEPILAVADAKGFVTIFYLRKDNENHALVFGESIECVDTKGTLALSIDWKSGNAENLQLVVSDSSGSISILSLIEGALVKFYTWHSHSHEAWIATFDNEDPNIVYSGGDDCKMIIYDLKQKHPIRTLYKEHGAGITALSCYRKQNILASGCYDERLRLWDKRNWKIPLSEIDLGGGVWKVKWHPNLEETLHNHLLAACMHAGFKLVNCNNAWQGEPLSESFTYLDHGSLAYGCDWCHSQVPLQLTPGMENRVVPRSLAVTCSFYDRKLCLWAVQRNNAQSLQ
ncbi:diphthine methyltransferase [Ischnura elegans]|uniref:diphthine methyltransferase n=1 Tax=Ischnura elegans TaxID=197161 RepID=UPI001ED8A2C7|nr:diphthine methyltransferase [Ischnura elegans]